MCVCVCVCVCVQDTRVDPDLQEPNSPLKDVNC